MNHRLVVILLLLATALTGCGSDAPPAAPDIVEVEPPPPPPVRWNGPYYLPVGWRGIWKEDACVMNGCGRPSMCAQTPPFPLCTSAKLFFVIEKPEDWEFDEIVVTDHEIRLSATNIMRNGTCIITTTVYYEAVRNGAFYDSFSRSEASWTGSCSGAICRETKGFGQRLSTSVGQNCDEDEAASLSSFFR